MKIALSQIVFFLGLGAIPLVAMFAGNSKQTRQTVTIYHNCAFVGVPMQEKPETPARHYSCDEGELIVQEASR